MSEEEEEEDSQEKFHQILHYNKMCEDDPSPPTRYVECLVVGFAVLAPLLGLVARMLFDKTYGGAL